MKKIAAILVTIACILGCILPAWGGKAHAYTYTVRIYSGEQGTIDGQDYITYTGLSYGDRITFDLGRVSLNDNSKYYVRGIRESGRDNNTVDAPSFIVEQDVDYVVAYGLMGDMVSYTLNYVDAATGAQLAPPEEHYVRDGDKPVAAYRYIEGYEPRYYNITGTVRSGQENSWTFLYDAVTVPAEPAAVTPVTPAVTPAEGAAGEGAAPVVPGEGAVTPEDQNTPGGQEVNPGDNGDNPEVNPPEPETPQEIIDIDDESVPYAAPDESEQETGSIDGPGSDPWPAIGIVAGSVAGAAAIALIIWLIARKKKNNDN